VHGAGTYQRGRALLRHLRPRGLRAAELGEALEGLQQEGVVGVAGGVEDALHHRLQPLMLAHDLPSLGGLCTRARTHARTQRASGTTRAWGERKDEKCGNAG
jgi:hypothetical protein